jgi:hypothetical protein
MGFHQGLRHDLPHRLELTTLGVLARHSWWGIICRCHKTGVAPVIIHLYTDFPLLTNHFWVPPFYLIISCFFHSNYHRRCRYFKFIILMIFNVYLDYYYTILLLRLYSHNITTQIPPSIKVEVIEWREAGGMQSKTFSRIYRSNRGLRRSVVVTVVISFRYPTSGRFYPRGNLGREIPNLHDSFSTGKWWINLMTILLKIMRISLWYHSLHMLHLLDIWCSFHLVNQLLHHWKQIRLYIFNIIIQLYTYTILSICT